MWHYTHEGATQGPVTHTDLCALFAAAQLPLKTPVWNESIPDWVPASAVDDFRGIWGKGFAAKESPPPAPRPAARTPNHAKTRPSLEVEMDGRVHRDDASQVRPWVRYWARGIDTTLLIAAAVYLFSDVWPEGLVYFPYVVVGSLVVHPIQLSLFGTTFGKALFGISVRNEHDEPPSIGQAVSREMSVLLRGMGFNILIIPLVTMALGYRRLVAEGVTSWDRDCGTVVRHKRVGFFRWVLWVLIGSALSLYVILNYPGVNTADAFARARQLSATRKAGAATGEISIMRTAPDTDLRPATQPAAKKPRPKPKLLTLPSEQATTKPPIKLTAPTTRPAKRKDRPAPRVIFKPEQSSGS